MPRVEVPNVGIVDFPDTMAQADIVAAIQKMSPVSAPPAAVPSAKETGFDLFGPEKAAFSAITSPAVRQGALPTLGAVGGGIAGGLIASPTVAGVPAGVLAGEAIGGAAGTAANQALGITEPSMTDIGMGAVAPGFGRALAGGAREALRYGFRMLPGAGGALHEQAVRVAGGLRDLIRPSGASDDLYKIVEGFNPPIPATNLQAAIGKLTSTEDTIAAGLDSAPIRKAAEGLRDLLTQHPNGVPFQTLRNNLRRLGEKTGAASRTGGEEGGAFKLLTRALHEDLEAAAASGGQAMPAVAALKAANLAAKKEFAQEDLAAIVEKAWSTRGDKAVTFQPGKILDGINKNTSAAVKFRKSVDPAELEEIRATLKTLTKIPALPPQAGVQFGSGPTQMRAGAVGSATLALTGDPTLALVAGGVAPGIHYVAAKALMSDRGRRLLIRMMQSGSPLDHGNFALLSAFVNSQFGQEPRQ